ncbi:MAG: hypothetical protein BGN97_15480 [Microbacterium sp. 69-10]|nr:MAG: hypothetical protein BGN97_15480 [Microbacterium sp. 69-10]
MRALVLDAAVGAADTAVGLPRQTPPRLVDVGVGVDDAGDREQAAPVDLSGVDRSAGSRDDLRDAVAVDQDVAELTAPG